jgi:predicted anti-sigma-YlaC factor YlaD
MDARCEETRDVLAELALGVADGEERGRALQHLAKCPECRAELEKLSDVADELSLLAPHREVPVGFESRVLSRVLPPPAPRRRRWPRFVLAPAAAALAAVGVTLAIVWNDVQTAHHYNSVLQQANGKEFEAYSLYDDGSPVGTVFSYQGAPSWVQIDVGAGHRQGLTSAALVTNDGTQIPLNWFRLDSQGASGGSIPVDPGQVSVLRLQPAGGGAPLVAHFH